MNNRGRGWGGLLCRQDLVHEVYLAKEFGLYLKGSEG